MELQRPFNYATVINFSNAVNALIISLQGQSHHSCGCDYYTYFLRTRGFKCGFNFHAVYLQP